MAKSIIDCDYRSHPLFHKKRRRMRRAFDKIVCSIAAKPHQSLTVERGKFHRGDHLLNTISIFDDLYDADKEIFRVAANELWHAVYCLDFPEGSFYFLM